MQVLQEQLDRLAGFVPVDLPVISLYLDAQPDQHGQDAYDLFIRQELEGRAATFETHTPARESFDRDVTRIRTYLADEVRPSANGIAIFACAGADGFFEAVQLDVPIERHRLYVTDQPHLYELARLNDAYPRYAALLVDSQSARLLVFGLGQRLGGTEIENQKVRRTDVGGWSQARFQRHTDNLTLQHVKEVVDALDRVVREDGIRHVILAGDETIIPKLRDQLPKHLAEKVVDVLRLDITTPEHEVLGATLAAMRIRDAHEDADRVQRLLDAWRSGGLGVVGIPDTLEALTRGQVDELLISPMLERRPPPPDGPPEEPVVDVSDRLVTQARATGAAVTFIEDSETLDGLGGVGALLRFSL